MELKHLFEWAAGHCTAGVAPAGTLLPPGSASRTGEWPRRAHWGLTLSVFGRLSGIGDHFPLRKKWFLWLFQSSSTYFDLCVVWSNVFMIQVPELLQVDMNIVPAPAPKALKVKTKLCTHNTFKLSRTAHSPSLGFLMQTIVKMTRKTTALHNTAIRMTMYRDRWVFWRPRTVQHRTFK